MGLTASPADPGTVRVVAQVDTDIFGDTTIEDLDIVIEGPGNFFSVWQGNQQAENREIRDVHIDDPMTVSFLFTLPQSAGEYRFRVGTGSANTCSAKSGVGTLVLP